MISDILFDLAGIDNSLLSDIFGVLVILIALDLVLRFIFGTISRLFGG